MLGRTIQGVLIPGSLTIPSTWQLLKISLVMNSFLIHRQSLHRMFKVPRCPQHSKYLFWNVSQRLHLLTALALWWSRPVNKYGLDSASQISCCLCHSRTQLGPSLLEIICLWKKNAHLSSTALFASPRKWDDFLWLTMALLASDFLRDESQEAGNYRVNSLWSKFTSFSEWLLDDSKWWNELGNHGHL